MRKKQLYKLAEWVLEQTQGKVDQTEVVLIASNLGLTRFADNRIHQNVVRDSMGVSIRVVKDQKIGITKANQVDKASLTKTLERAVTLAKNQAPDPDFVSLPKPSNYAPVNGFYDSTASFSPLARANKVKNVIKQAKSSKLKAFGALSTGMTEYVIANSRGIMAYFPQTEANFSTTMMSENASGVGSDLNLNIDQLAIETQAKKAINLCLMGKSPQKIKPGEYEVVLTPKAMESILTYLAYIGFGARAYHEDRSFLSGKLGKKVMGKNITIIDDPLNNRGIPIPFDLEGSAKKKIVLIKQGIAKNVVYDHYLARKFGQKNTGHGLPAPNTLDALATHLHLQPAVHSGCVRTVHTRSAQVTLAPPRLNNNKKPIKTSKNSPFSTDELELIKQVQKGLFITRFWYVNAHHHKTITLTGLTRDGTFWIENGMIKHPVENLRFTQSVPEALNNVAQIGSKSVPVESWFGAHLTPPIRIKKFRFTGVSKL